MCYNSALKGTVFMQTENCTICPRNCKINRTTGKSFCGATTLKIAKVMKHFWEEPIISGDKGSGAIFFSHCNLKCMYCQNAEISHEGFGQITTVEKLADLFRQLESSGVHNINLVTPTHYNKEIMAALDIYKPNIPIVYNTSGYDSVKTIRKLKKYIDIYLCDFKYYDNALANEYSRAPDYFEAVTDSLKQMRKNQPKDVIENGIMKKGIIVRHLILPTHSSDSIRVLEWIYDNLGKDTIVSLMSQYTPYYKALTHPILKNRVKSLEYKRVVQKFISLGFTNGFCQEQESATCDYIPNFKEESKEFVF